MIEIIDKYDCCGCSACVQTCPVQCIAMEEDIEGFLYPLFNKDKCIKCNRCSAVCPVINQDISRKPLKVYAAKSINEDIRLESSSGGVFTLFAESIIKKDGVVFGARFNEQWEVVHDYTEDIEGLSRSEERRVGKEC